MKKRSLGHSGLDIAPLVLGGNVFGWTIDEPQSFRILSQFVDRGFNMIDTANCYSIWASGNRGGESETIIGNWLKKTNNRQRVLLATKVGMDMGAGGKGLKKDYIIRAVEESLRRLQTDVIDLYQSHTDDLGTPVSETLEAYDILIKSGKIRAIGASQFSTERLREALPGYTCLQPLYNLYDREPFESKFAPLCKQNDLGVITYYSLASGFLSGKYRKSSDLGSSPRSSKVESSYLNEKGMDLLDALESVSLKLKAPMATVALAWILANPVVTAPIASATKESQLSEILDAVDLKLDQESLATLNFP